MGRDGSEAREGQATARMAKLCVGSDGAVLVSMEPPCRREKKTAPAAWWVDSIYSGPFPGRCGPDPTRDGMRGPGGSADKEPVGEIRWVHRGRR